MAKKQSPRKPPSKPKPGKGKLKPLTDKAEPEKVKIGPLDPPPPGGGGATTIYDDSKDT